MPCSRATSPAGRRRSMTEPRAGGEWERNFLNRWETDKRRCDVASRNERCPSVALYELSWQRHGFTAKRRQRLPRVRERPHRTTD